MNEEDRKINKYSLVLYREIDGEEIEIDRSTMLTEKEMYWYMNYVYQCKEPFEEAKKIANRVADEFMRQYDFMCPEKAQEVRDYVENMMIIAVNETLEEIQWNERKSK